MVETLPVDVRNGQVPSRDFLAYLPTAELWKDALREYDIVQGYAIDPVIPVLCEFKNFAAYEHGTLRLLFEDSERGHVCAFCYRAAPRVFVTNSDVVPAARQLGLTESQMVFLPHAVDSDRLLRFGEASEHLRPAAGEPLRVISPTRHDWADSDPLWAKGNDRLILGLAAARAQGVDCHLTLAEWGRHVEESKKLIAALGLEAVVTWLEPLPKRSLWSAFLSHHAVVDQFLTPALGSIGFESLALGCRVITALDESTCTEFFGAMPPVFNCATADQISAALQSIAADPGDSACIGAAGRDWFVQRHSSARIVALEVDAYRGILEET
jgi:glycosyltransferase involved in cell wall biosynthesis